MAAASAKITGFADRFNFDLQLVRNRYDIHLHLPAITFNRTGFGWRIVIGQLSRCFNFLIGESHLVAIPVISINCSSVTGPGRKI